MISLDLHGFIVVFTAGISAGAQVLAYVFWLGQTAQEKGGSE